MNQDPITFRVEDEGVPPQYVQAMIAKYPQLACIMTRKCELAEIQESEVPDSQGSVPRHLIYVPRKTWIIHPPRPLTQADLTLIRTETPSFAKYPCSLLFYLNKDMGFASCEAAPAGHSIDYSVGLEAFDPKEIKWVVYIICQQYPKPIIEVSIFEAGGLLAQQRATAIAEAQQIFNP